MDWFLDYFGIVAIQSQGWTLNCFMEGIKESKIQGLPWRSSGLPLHSQCTGHGFDPWSGN